MKWNYTHHPAYVRKRKYVRPLFYHQLKCTRFSRSTIFVENVSIIYVNLHNDNQ